MTVVYVVLWNNYGDQGSDFLGTFSTREKAESFIFAEAPKIEKNENYWNWVSPNGQEYSRSIETSDFQIIESKINALIV